MSLFILPDSPSHKKSHNMDRTTSRVAAHQGERICQLESEKQLTDTAFQESQQRLLAAQEHIRDLAVELKKVQASRVHSPGSSHQCLPKDAGMAHLGQTFSTATDREVALQENLNKSEAQV